MVQNNIKLKDSGFTIVELLVVIVVIGVLAAITIVSYTGITARANTSSAQSAANAVIQKATAYAAEPTTTSNFPLTLGLLTGAASTTSYYLSGVSFNALGSAPATPNLIQYQLCGTGAGYPTAPVAPATNITSITGIRAGYWNYDQTTPGVQYLTAGTTTGTGVACLTTAS